MTTQAAKLSAAIKSQLDHPDAFVSKSGRKHFVLDSDDFHNLQKYLFAAAMLPADQATFLSQFPEAIMAKHLTAGSFNVCILRTVWTEHRCSSTQYWGDGGFSLTMPDDQDIKVTLPTIHSNSASFQINTIAPLKLFGKCNAPSPPLPSMRLSSTYNANCQVTAAAQIEVFASHTSGRIKDISEKLVIVIDNTDTKAVADSRKRIKVLLDRLQVDANNIKVKSDKLRIDLDKVCYPVPMHRSFKLAILS